MFKYLSLLLIFLVFSTCQSDDLATDRDYSGWAVYGGTKEMSRYSSLDQIDTSNVGLLEPLWVYRSGDADTAANSQIQCNPIVVDGTLYGVSPQMRLFALDAASGEHLWTFDAATDTRHDANRTSFHIMINSRGIAHWTDGADDSRIFFTAGSRTYAVDAQSGNAIESFGQGGYIDLHDGFDRDVSDLFIVNTSPVTIFEDLLITGARVDESTPSAPGDIRAFDVRTGERRWIFHTIPHPDEPGWETWSNPNAWQTSGGVNVWSGFSLDEERGILFAPTGSAAYDFYGADRHGENLYANCLLALNARTGELIWHYQLVHHDLWDKDLPSPPALVTVERDGQPVDAVAQITKSGLLFVFNRETGEPLFEIEEVAVRTDGALPGEAVWPTQPIPTKPAPFARVSLTKEDINPYLSEEETEWVATRMAEALVGEQYIPPGPQPVIMMPGFDGGGEWSGPAFDPETALLYVNANELANWLEMVENPWLAPEEENWLQAGQRIYRQQCMSCHGVDRRGTGNNPTLVGLEDRYDRSNFAELVRAGRRMMPAFPRLETEEIDAIASYILNLEDIQQNDFSLKGSAEPDIYHQGWKLKGYTQFKTPSGLPAHTPPWGTLSAIDLNSGDYAWQIPLGNYAAYADQPEMLGAQNYGGPVVTAGGLLFIAATPDRKMRAFHKRTGELLWEYELPTAGFATPAVYEMDGRQILVIACGGGKLNTLAGDAYMAFALPE
ncbi:MAG: PQQ-binding-like beta-propeller repeat protein [Bacteroidota bacterium]